MDKKSVTLTVDEWRSLHYFLLISATFRKDEIQAWERMAKENTRAASNAEFWRKNDSMLRIVMEAIEKI